MTYSVKNSALTTTYTVNDNTENSTSTSLIFIGKNYTGYGLALNENFLYLLENFSNTVGNYPSNPVAGQLFWDNTNKYMHVYDGAAWKVIYGALASLTVNTAVSFNGITTNNGGQVSGYLTGALGANIPNTVVATSVTTSSGGQITGYHTGAIGANVANSGVFTTVAASTVNANVVGNVGSSHYGTIATNAQPFITSVGTLSSLNVGGNILLSAAGAKITFNTGGGTIANNIGNSLQFYTDGGTTELMRLDNAGNLNVYGGSVRAATINAATIGNAGATFTGATAIFNGGFSGVATNFNTNPASLDVGRIFAIYNTNYMPGASFSISDNRIFDFGVQTGNIAYIRTSGTNGLQLNAGGNGFSFNNSILPSSNASINIGSTSNYWNNVYAVNFLGTSTTAKYADLAEKYLPDAEYEIGTVMMVGGTAEVTQHNGDRIRAIGVTSAYPAYKMNSDLEGGTYVALKGRVPVRVVGPVKKGQSLFGTAHGLAMATDETTAITFAIALESFDGNGIGVVEAVIL